MYVILKNKLRCSHASGCDLITPRRINKRLIAAILFEITFKAKVLGLYPTHVATISTYLPLDYCPQLIHNYSEIKDPHVLHSNHIE
jgi:hypothetical protein